MKKYYFFATGCEHWLNVARELHDKNIATPVFWLGDDRDSKRIKAKFGDDVVQSMLYFVHRPWVLNGVEYNGEHSEFFFSENYLRAKDRCLKMMDRLDLYGLFTRLDREAYFNKLAIWFLKNLEKNVPDALVMADSPHSHAQYLLFEICQFLNVPTAKFNSFAMLVPTLILEDMSNNVVLKNERDSCGEVYDRIDRVISDYVSTVVEKASKGGYELSYIKAQRKQNRFWSKFYKMMTEGAKLEYKATKFQIGTILRGVYNPINPHNVSPLGRLRIEHGRRKNIKKLCVAHCDKPALEKAFVYFALHYEPERTTNPDGDKFHDQVLAIVALRSFLPDEVEIVVKEHPTQFYERQRGHRGRSPLLYNLIKNIKGVRLLGPFEDSIELQRECLFVATITGSIAVEAALLGKKTIMFGKTWFLGFPNIYAWEDCVDYQQLLDMPIIGSDTMLQRILDFRKRHCVVGYQNISLERRYADYSDDFFQKEQHEGVFGLLQKYFVRLDATCVGN
jgi:hypothetical protein